MTQIVLLEIFKDGTKTAEEDITRYSVDELGLLLDIQQDMGRTWSYKTIKQRRDLMKRYRLKNSRQFIEVPLTTRGRAFLEKLRKDDPSFRCRHIKIVDQDWPLVVRAAVKHDLRYLIF